MLFRDFVSDNGVPKRSRDARTSTASGGMLGQPIRYYITSGRKEEMVTADSTFATLLLRGLRGEADFFRQGLVSADELGIYLSREVPKYSYRPQTPQFSSYRQRQTKRGPVFLFNRDSCDEIERRRAPS